MAAIGNALDNAQLKADKSVVDAHLKTDLSCQISRSKAYIKDKPTVVITVMSSGVMGGVVGSVVGGVTFGAGAALVAATTKLPVDVNAAIEAGSAVGFTVGSVIATKKKVLQIKGSTVYQNWKAEAIFKNVYPIFEKYVAENIAQPYKCIYTLSLVHRPVRDSHGHVFEQEYIHKEMDAHGGTINCPHNTLPITKNELTFDLLYHRDVMNIIKPAFDAAVQNPVVVAGALAFRSAVKEERVAMFNADMAPFTERLLGCKNQQERDEVLKQYNSAANNAAEKYKLD
jgi:hypothetical protein